MKYVTLEHKLALTCNPYVNFDTNDNSFETEIYALRSRYYREHEDAKNQILDEMEQVLDTSLQTKKGLDDLRHDTPILKRFSKEYRAERERLQKTASRLPIRYLKLQKEIEHLDDNIFKPFNKYHDIKQLLKESGYVLVNKTTSDTHTTTEIWHKND
jgi:hypothetical protein